MTEDVSKLAIAEVIKLWSSQRADARPGSMWITSHLPVESADDTMDTDVDAAWFFDGRDVSERKPTDYIRFIAVHTGAFWHCAVYGPPPSGVFGRVHEIGLAHFCRVEGREEMLIETIFGGLNGSGILYRIEEGILVAESKIWLS